MSEKHLSDGLHFDLAPRWKAETKYRHRTKRERDLKLPQEEICHELKYGMEIHEIDKGERGLNRLRNMADLFNKHRVIPRDRPVQCLADDSGGIDARLKKQNRRCKAPGFGK